MNFWVNSTRKLQNNIQRIFLKTSGRISKIILKRVFQRISEGATGRDHKGFSTEVPKEAFSVFPAEIPGRVFC